MKNQMVASSLPFMAVIIPVLGGLSASFINDEKKNHYFSVLVSVFTFISALLMTPAILGGKILISNMPTGLRIDFSFFADPLSYLCALIFSAVWMLCTIYGVEYMVHENNQKRYNVVSLLSLAGAMGVVLTKNLFTLYIFFELLCVASFVMVIHSHEPEARDAGKLYIFVGVSGGLMMLCSSIATYAITGTGDLIKLASYSGKIYEHGLGITKGLAVGSWVIPLIFVSFCLGFGAKAGLFPVHIWLPDAHPVAPAPGSALLSGVMIKAGAYGIIRAIYVVMGAGFVKIEPHKMSMILLVLACTNIFYGSARAIREKEIKRMLAFSSVSQVGYILLGMALLTQNGLTGSIVHIFNHAIMKGCLFLCAGAFIHQTGLRQIDDLRGIGKRMPLTMICFTLSAMSMVGFPPFSGFISKWFLGIGSLEVIRMSGPHPFGTIVGVGCLLLILLSAFMNLVYYGPIVFNAWFPNTDDPVWQSFLKGSSSGGHGDLLGEKGSVNVLGKGTDDPGGWMMWPILILGFGNVVFGIFPHFPVKVATMASKLLLSH